MPRPNVPLGIQPNPVTDSSPNIDLIQIISDMLGPGEGNIAPPIDAQGTTFSGGQAPVTPIAPQASAPVNNPVVPPDSGTGQLPGPTDFPIDIEQLPDPRGVASNIDPQQPNQLLQMIMAALGGSPRGTSF
jgi:hypothetical protein